MLIYLAPSYSFIITYQWLRLSSSFILSDKPHFGFVKVKRYHFANISYVCYCSRVLFLFISSSYFPCTCPYASIPNFTVCATALKEVKGRGKCAMEGRLTGDTEGSTKKDAEKSHEASSLVDLLFFFRNRKTFCAIPPFSPDL